MNLRATLGEDEFFLAPSAYCCKVQKPLAIDQFQCTVPPFFLYFLYLILFSFPISWCRSFRFDFISSRRTSSHLINGKTITQSQLMNYSTPLGLRSVALRSTKSSDCQLFLTGCNWCDSQPTSHSSSSSLRSYFLRYFGSFFFSLDIYNCALVFVPHPGCPIMICTHFFNYMLEAQHLRLGTSSRHAFCLLFHNCVLYIYYTVITRCHLVLTSARRRVIVSFVLLLFIFFLGFCPSSSV